MTESELCTFEGGCDRPVDAKGLCRAHYRQQWRGKELTPIQEKKRKPNETYCLVCDTQKTREDFYLRADGKPQSACKDCTKKSTKARTARVRQALAALEAASEALQSR